MNLTRCVAVTQLPHTHLGQSHAMSSVRFLVTIVFHLIDLSTPFRRARQPWHRQTVEVVRWALIALLIGGPAFLCATVSLTGAFSSATLSAESSFALFCNSAAAIPIFLLGVLWPSLAAFLVSPLILRHREHRSWDTVLSTPYPRRDILTGTIATSFAGFEGLLQFTLFVQGCMAVIAALHALRLAQLGISSALCAVGIVWVVALFAVERAQETSLAFLLGVAASYVARSWPIAATGAVVAGLVMRLVQLWLLVLIALAADPAQAGSVFRDALLMGSTAAMFRFTPLITALAPVAIIAARELAFRGLLGWLIREMGGE